MTPELMMALDVGSGEPAAGDMELAANYPQTGMPVAGFAWSCVLRPGYPAPCPVHPVNARPKEHPPYFTKSSIVLPMD